MFFCVFPNKKDDIQQHSQQFCYVFNLFYCVNEVKESLCSWLFSRITQNCLLAEAKLS